jgi:hypothetical protein
MFGISDSEMGKEQKLILDNLTMMSKLLIYLGIGVLVIFSLRFLKERRESNIIKRHHAKLREKDAALQKSLEESGKELN